MKTFAAAFVSASFSVASLQAQILQPSTVNGAVLGGVAGAVIGKNSGDLHHNAWRGAAIGTVAGAVVGSAVGSSREHASYDRNHVGVSIGYGGYYGRPRWGGRNYSGAPWLGYGYDFHNYGYDYDYGYPSTYYRSSYDSDYYYQPSHSTSGLLLGGITGAIIGNNSRSHNAWRGAALGGGAGWLLGTIADQNYRRRVVEVRPQLEPAETTPAHATNSPQNVTIINNYYGNSTAMSSANSLFGR